MGLEFLSEVLPNPFSSSAPFPQAAAQHHRLCSIMFSISFPSGHETTKSFKSSGTSQRVKWKKAHSEYSHPWHSSLPDPQPLRGDTGSGMERKNPDFPEMDFRRVTEMVFHTFWTLHRAKKRMPGNMVDVFSCVYTWFTMAAGEIFSV